MANTDPPTGGASRVPDQLRQVSTATLTMVLLKRGVRTSWLRGVKPLVPLSARVAGPAFTIRFVPGREDLSQPESYAKSPSFRDAIEAAPRGSVVVIDGRGNTLGATLGDILVARLAKKGVLAAITDAPVRDADEIRGIDLPVLCAGVAAPPSIVGLAFAGYDEIIGCGGVAVCPGDVMVCDNDGAVVIPAALAAEVAEAGIEQERFERFVQRRIAEGAAVVGLYPPDEKTLEDYRKWLDDGEP
ncbi:MAG: ribonuclease activity regulator RraA [Gammaproteobacteria bacterium]|nr:ribonuclease activity regulator RraA [Gammaproteobacteria bacterium]NIM72820.1 ribonuclease activity regulator RraA [Gammaproteobacteria bacterium]NIN38278.1 ribonuclease activity regulator RraA [Gammaproteobacteria bacterium]NIO24568.1 ribonuclease activity regulator RraA [Gammaproteobacteria bacterium]NIO65177.1 ribonuclease activity regulator RraA [Gammaproteobacteria bacterium]